MRLFTAGLAVLIVAVVSTLGTMVVLAVSDTYGGISFHPFTMDPNNDTCVQWTEPSGLATRNCDPVNLVFPEMSWQQVTDALEAQGWTTSSLGSTQRLHLADETTLIQQHVQLVRSDGRIRRYHIRLWEAPGPVTVAAVHHEKGRIIHTIDKSWEDSEAFVASQLCGFGFSCTTTDVLTEQLRIQDLDPDGDPDTWRGWLNNGAATVVNPSAPQPIVAGLDPATGTQGQTLDIAITGSNTNFDSTSLVDFTSPSDSTVQITVNSVSVTTSTELTANITITENAETGLYNVTVTTGVEVATGQDLFEVKAADGGRDNACPPGKQKQNKC